MSDAEVLERLLFICEQEHVKYTNDGLESLLFCCDGDLRVAVNSLQATASGFDVVNSDNVLKVCDQPPPAIAKQIIISCTNHDMKGARSGITTLWDQGYSASDIVGTIFKVTKDAAIPEKVKLEYLKEIGMCQLRIAEGIATLIQLLGLVGKLCVCSIVCFYIPCFVYLLHYNAQRTLCINGSSVHPDVRV